MNLHTTAIISE